MDDPAWHEHPPVPFERRVKISDHGEENVISAGSVQTTVRNALRRPSKKGKTLSEVDR